MGKSWKIRKSENILTGGQEKSGNLKNIKSAILLMQIGIAKCLIFVTVLYKDMIEHFKTSIYCLGF